MGRPRPEVNDEGAGKLRKCRLVTVASRGISCCHEAKVNVRCAEPDIHRRYPTVYDREKAGQTNSWLLGDLIAMTLANQANNVAGPIDDHGKKVGNVSPIRPSSATKEVWPLAVRRAFVSTLRPGHLSE